MIKIKSNKIIVGESLFDGYVYIENEKIVNVTKEDINAETFYDYTGFYVSPGFIEMHTHGAGNCSFMFGSPEEVAKGCDYHLKFGTTSIMPTVSACGYETMESAVKNIAKAKSLTKSNLIGAHLEGPYFSLAQAGAQSPDFITEPIKSDYEKLIKNYGQYIARWSYAPERDKNGEFCKYLTENGIIASAGHTDAIYEDIKVAIDNGCRLVTHLFSGTSTITRDHGFRRLGVIESCFLRDELTAEIIADGRHLPPELIKLILKVKGTDKVILCTDSLEITGTDIKEGVSGHTEFIVEDGVCKLKDRTAFAGSIATGNRLIQVLVKECGIQVPTAVKMFTTNPANFIGLNKGLIKEGKDADLVIFDEDIMVKSIFVLGKQI